MGLKAEGTYSTQPDGEWKDALFEVFHHFICGMEIDASTIDMCVSVCVHAAKSTLDDAKSYCKTKVCVCVCVWMNVCYPLLGSYYFRLIVFCHNHLSADWNNDPVRVQDALTFLPPDCRSGKHNSTHKNPSFFVMLTMSSDRVLRFDVAPEFRSATCCSVKLNYVSSLFTWMHL